MKFKKAMALLLTVSMIGSVAGCAKAKSVSQEDFINACEQMGASEVDPDDNDVDDSDLEDGVYMICDSDFIEENMSSDSLSSYSSMTGSDIPSVDSIIDPEDIEEAVIFARAVQNIEDIEDPDDIEDLDINGIIGMHFTLTSDDLAEGIMENLADSLDEFNIDVEDLSSNEYYEGKNEGYIKIHIEAEDLVAAFMDSEVYGYIESFAGSEIDLEETLGALTGCVGVAFYIKGENAVVILGAEVNSDESFIDDFCSELSVGNPCDLPSNVTVAESLCDYIDDSFGPMISMFASYASADSGF